MARPIRPDRIRTWRGTTYGWVDHRLRPWLRHLSTEEQAVYLFLVLAADRVGVSWYAHATIGKLIGVDPGDVRLACGGLRRLGLIAYRAHRPNDADGVFQVLSVPPPSPPRETVHGEGGARSLGQLLRRRAPEGPA